MFFLKCAKSFGRFSSKNTSNAEKYVNICGEEEEEVLQNGWDSSEELMIKLENSRVGEKTNDALSSLAVIKKIKKKGLVCTFKLLNHTNVLW